MYNGPSYRTVTGDVDHGAREAESTLRAIYYRQLRELEAANRKIRSLKAKLGKANARVRELKLEAVGVSSFSNARKRASC